MKYVRFHEGEGVRWGVLKGMSVRVVDGDSISGYSETRHVVKAKDLKLLPPATPGKTIGIGLNYAAHAAEGGKRVPTEPLMFMKPPSAVIGAGDTVTLPNPQHRTDHEAELAVVIGRRCRDLTADNWRNVVLGYTYANDVSDRVLQRRDDQYTRGNGFDTFCPLGPGLVDAIDPSDIAIRCSVNGVLRQDSRTKDMIFSVESLLRFVSRVMTLEPWDVILTGTPEGVGPIAPGDEVRVEVERIGTLTNRVAARGSRL